ncbi:DUF4214 domain-containing protein [Methylobacterium durans]|uniref:DUF4214 domain-containing protein n=1 Tax=Methylobacterium durans TaxID=2202825 RepID=UPI002B000320|nr:DUF4214 domain-containing protein [Methylobacterium durans]MEA1832187.1 DUF4214 domain-containing protein [Methylobacterium durans]
MSTLIPSQLARQLSLEPAPTVTAASSALWHLQSGGSVPGIDAVDAWRYATGKGVSVGVFDDGAKHATAVTGIIGAKPSATAPLGVAYNATLTNYQVIGIANASIASVLSQAAKFDVTNNSWGWDAMLYVNRLSSAWTPFFTAIENAAETGRGGLGTTQVVAAGNSRAAGNDANLSNFASDRHVIAVGAVTSEGKVAYYSNPGASLLVSAPSSGGLRSITTTDLAGSAGYSATDVTDTFGGTSAATPQVAGVVALMLEANAHLGWRDVRTILAMSAEQPTGIGTVTNAGTHWNGGGMMFSNDTGYGVVDARAAVRLAQTWTVQNTSWNEVNIDVAAKGTQTLSASRSISYTFNVTQAISLETAEITLSGNHSRVGDLKIQLISPNGTVSTLLDQKGGSTAFSGFTFTSNAFLGEGGTGQWTLKVSEGAGAATGTFTDATLSLHGANGSDDTFVFTDAYAGLAGRNVLQSTSGHGAINAAASTGNDVIDLHAGAWSTIAGKAVQISGDSLFTTAIAGDGHVKLIGNDAANLLVAGHGNGSFYGAGGNDIFVSGSGSNYMDGGTGINTLVESGTMGQWTLARGAGGSWTLKGADGKVDTFVDVQRIHFDDHVLALDIDANAGGAFRLYGAALNRAPDVQGLSYWVDQLDKGQSLKAVAENFMTSVEFTSRFGANLDSKTFVANLYDYALNRTADTGGLQYWSQALDAHALDRADVLVQFSNSAENASRLASSADSASRLYAAAFDRAPDANGLYYWMDQIHQGKTVDSVADFFMQSAEFKGRYGENLGNGAFVSELYHNVMHRDGDASGIAYWTNALDSHALDRADVLVQFSTSAEYLGRHVDTSYGLILA